MAGTILPQAVETFVDANGKPLAGGSVYMYIPNTTTFKNTWQDPALTILNTNPIILNASGQAIIWGTGSYRQQVFDVNNNLIWDQVTEDTSSGLLGNMTDDTFVAGTDFTPGATTTLTLSVAPGSIQNTWIYFDAAYQADNSIASLNGTTLTFNAPIPIGTQLVTVKIGSTVAIGTPGDGTVTDATVAANAGIKGTKINFQSSFAGTVSRTVQSKLNEFVSVLDFGAVGDGVNDDTAAFNAAATACSGRSIFVPDPPVNYVISNLVTLPANTIMFGEGKFTTKIFKKGNNDMFSLGDGAGLREVWIDGQGATNTGGQGIVLNSTDGHQSLVDCRVINFPDLCVNFPNTQVGSQFIALNCEFNQYGATSGSNRFAIGMHDAAQLSAVPRTFIGCEFEGTPSFNFGGCNDVFVSGCFTGDLNYTLNSRGVQIANSRIANQTALSIYGHNHTIVGCDVNPQITLTPGVDNCHIGPNSLNNAPIIDNSGNGRNQLFDWNTNYTPTLSSAGTQPAIGNGTIAGRWLRTGSLIKVSIQFAPGSTTTFGTGELQFSLPTPNTSDVSQLGTWTINHGGTIYTGVGVVSANAQVIGLLRDTSGAVTGTSPAIWAAGDLFNIDVSYSAGV